MNIDKELLSAILDDVVQKVDGILSSITLGGSDECSKELVSNLKRLDAIHKELKRLEDISSELKEM